MRCVVLTLCGALVLFGCRGQQSATASKKPIMSIHSELGKDKIDSVLRAQVASGIAENDLIKELDRLGIEYFPRSPGAVVLTARIHPPRRSSPLDPVSRFWRIDYLLDNDGKLLSYQLTEEFVGP